MKNSNKVTINKFSAPVLATALLTVLSVCNVVEAASSAAWSCSAWKQDPVNSCVETKTCTRTLCDAKGKLDNCRIETKTSTATKANCTPPKAKPGAGILRQGFVSQGVMMNAPSVKPILTKPVLGASVNKIPATVDKQPGINRSAVQQPERRLVTKPLSTTKKTQPTNKKRVSLPGTKRLNIAKPNTARSLQVPVLKTAPTISSLKAGTQSNKVRRTPVVFPKGVQGPGIKNSSGVKKGSLLGGSGFVPAQSVSAGSSSNIVGGLVSGGEYTGTEDLIKEINIPFAFFAIEMQSAFQGTKVHLNNYGPRHGNSWYKGNDSFVELPAALGGVKKQFSFPVKNAFPFRYYMNNVNLSSIQVNTSQNKLAIEFNFESNGKEIKGRCSNSIKCILGSDLSAPDVQMNNTKASVYLTPSARNGSISFSQVESDFTADIQAQGACDVIGISYVCNALTGYKSEIKNASKQAIQNAVDSDSIRNEIAEKMRLKLVSYGVKDVVSVEVLSNILVIKHRVRQGQMAIK